MLSDPCRVICGKTNKKERHNRGWSRQPPRFIKLNVDGSALGKPGPAGIGDALRDHEGFIRGISSHPIGPEDSNYAELIAIKKGISFFLSTPCLAVTLSL
ncbi:Uncharacterized protein TCM_045479 [Theobroma cacao]|uniref:RNase H type-1 domain-containing protein n=1 Tax=Theobroma cacao TaxID=3641 RepID=A0A061FSL2_THECC|nr:Uncharacterized protein TCM_045479 [Theobroma cacao]